MADVGQAPKKPRFRASIACSSCRAKRVKCLFGDGQTECDYCRNTGKDCVIRDDDGRKGPKRTYQALTERLQVLENVLRTNEPLASGLPATALADSLVVPQIASKQSVTLGKTAESVLSMSGNGAGRDEVMTGATALNAPFSDANAPPDVLRTSGMSDLNVWLPSQDASLDYETELFIQELPSDLHDGLLDYFWLYYNSTFHFVDRDIFYDGKRKRNPETYSYFLHLCILSIGFRYADRRDSRITALGANGWQSVLHLRAKLLGDIECKKPSGTHSVQGLLLLGDLEFGAGRYDSGWMYTGMASRICFDLGLHQMSHSMEISGREERNREMILRACITFDRCWAMFLGCPQSVKSSRLPHLSHDEKSRLNQRQFINQEPILDTAIYIWFLNLTDLTTEVAENIATHPLPDYQSRHSVILALHHKLLVWHDTLPQQLRWMHSTIHSMPNTLLLLHQHYHATVLLLHSQYAFEIRPRLGTTDTTTIEILRHSRMQSQQICFYHAIQIAYILSLRLERLNTRTIYTNEIQHAAAAAEVLVKRIPLIVDSAEPIKYLRYLLMILQTNATSHLPAERAFATIRKRIEDLGLNSVLFIEFDFLPLQEPSWIEPRGDARVMHGSGTPSPAHIPELMPSQEPDESNTGPQFTSHDSPDEIVNLDDLAFLAEFNYSGLLDGRSPSQSEEITKRKTPTSRIFRVSNEQAVPANDSLFFANELEMLGLFGSNDDVEPSSNQGFPQWPASNAALTP